MAFVLAVMAFSKSSIGGKAKPDSIDEVIGFTITPASIAKPL